MRSPDVEMRSIPSESSTSSDPASSLRAAALLTLKSKRRKAPIDPPTVKVLPSRPPPSDAGFQLDYGQEDGTPLRADTPISAPTGQTKPVSHDESVEDGQAREEGEISDEEGTQSSPPKPQSHSPTPLPQTPDVSESSRRPTPPTLTPPQESLHRTKLSDRITDPPSNPAMYRQSTPSISLPTDVIIHEKLPYTIDADHVRPGIAC